MATPPAYRVDLILSEYVPTAGDRAMFRMVAAMAAQLVETGLPVPDAYTTTLDRYRAEALPRWADALDAEHRRRHFAPCQATYVTTGEQCRRRPFAAWADRCRVHASTADLRRVTTG